MSLLNINELDLIFISYDEPNAEINYAKLLAEMPWAKRVHGVKGSDACHKAAANLSETEWFVTVDADNVINPEFLNLQLDLDQYPRARAFNWPGRNCINGLRYGNGSLKVWRKDFVLNMKTHEAAENENGQVDFCWEDGYYPLTKSYSETIINASPQQAWRAGFREGVKMCLDRGVRPPKDKTAVDVIWWENLHRLKIWLSVGLHAQQGAWAIAGAWEGVYRTACTDWDIKDVRDFDVLTAMFKERAGTDPAELIEQFRQGAKDFLYVPILDSTTSKYVVDTFDEFYRLHRV
jgi:hypothetical protein